MKTPSTKFAVLIAHHEPVMRIGLAHVIGSHERLRVCGEAASAAELQRSCELCLPDVVVVDPEKAGGGVVLLRDLARWAPRSRRVVFSGQADALQVQRAFAAGALGYVTRQDDASELAATILHSLDGQRHVGPYLSTLLLDKLACGDIEMHGGREHTLSDRELQVFRLIGAGTVLREVAARLGVSVKTVETHRQRIKGKLNLRSCADLQRAAVLHFDQGHAGQRQQALP